MSFINNTKHYHLYKLSDVRDYYVYMKMNIFVQQVRS
jgi:hypothetical protein